MRFTSEKFGIVSPVEFIPIIENDNPFREANRDGLFLLFYNMYKMLLCYSKRLT